MQRWLEEQFLESHQFNMMEGKLALEIGILHSGYMGYNSKLIEPYS